MLSFKIEGLCQDVKELCLDISENYADCECLFSICCGCLVTRIFDDTLGYAFLAPAPIADKAAVSGAISEICEYCVREDIPEIYVGIEAEQLGDFLRGVRHAEVHAQDSEGTLFTVEIKNELSMLPSGLEFDFDCLTLCYPSLDMADRYESLISDAEHNKYYGYELRDDMPSAEAEDVIAAAVRDNEAYRSLTLAALIDGELVGEGVLFGFDGRGNAELSLRVMRSKCGRGIGAKLLSAFLNLCEEMALRNVRARVHKQNTASIALMRGSEMLFAGTCEDVCFFEKRFY